MAKALLVVQVDAFGVANLAKLFYTWSISSSWMALFFRLRSAPRVIVSIALQHGGLRQTECTPSIYLSVMLEALPEHLLFALVLQLDTKNTHTGIHRAAAFIVLQFQNCLH